MTRKQVQRITKQLGHQAIRRARAQYNADVVLLESIFAMTDYLNAWDDAIEEDGLRTCYAAAVDILDILNITALQ